MVAVSRLPRRLLCICATAPPPDSLRASPNGRRASTQPRRSPHLPQRLPCRTSPKGRCCHLAGPARPNCCRPLHLPAAAPPQQATLPTPIQMEGSQAVQEAAGGLDIEDKLLTRVDLVSNVPHNDIEMLEKEEEDDYDNAEGLEEEEYAGGGGGEDEYDAIAGDRGRRFLSAVWKEFVRICIGGVVLS